MRKFFLILWSVGALVGAASLTLFAPSSQGELFTTLSRTV